jgi:hypothetical protein
MIECCLLRNGGCCWNKTRNVDFWQDMATGMVVESGRVVGVKTSIGL